MLRYGPAVSDISGLLIETCYSTVDAMRYSPDIIFTCRRRTNKIRTAISPVTRSVKPDRAAKLAVPIAWLVLREKPSRPTVTDIGRIALRMSSTERRINQ